MCSCSTTLPSPPILMLRRREPPNHGCPTYAQDPRDGAIVLTKMMKPMDLREQALSIFLVHTDNRPFVVGGDCSTNLLPLQTVSSVFSGVRFHTKVSPYFLLPGRLPSASSRVRTVDSKVRLVVYDMLGREVAVLADGRFPAGNYRFTFDGKNLSSGMNFCRLVAGGYTAMRKMMLVR